MSKLWDKGQPLDQLVEEYTVGDDPVLDLRLLPHDVRGSKAHARMLAACGVLEPGELSSLLAVLDEILEAHERSEFEIRREDEDVHTAIERVLVERLGDVGKKIHTGRSRNDQVLTDLRLWQRHGVTEAESAVNEAIAAFRDFAERWGDVPLPGYTHLQRAMPSSVGSWARAYASLLGDNVALLQAADSLASSSPLGSAAGYGVPEELGVDRVQTAEELGFARVQEPAEACQSSRGKAEASFLFALSQIAGDLSKCAWDLCLFVTAEFGFFRLPIEFTTGSSIMPQKRNPDVLELTRGKAAIVRSALLEVMQVAAPLPSGYHRDLQLVKAPLFRGFDVTMSMLAVMTRVLAGLEVDEERCRGAMSRDLYATEEACKLVRAGVPFRDAYKQVAAAFSDDSQNDK